MLGDAPSTTYVWKYDLAGIDGSTTIMLPEHFKVLDLREQGGKLRFWAVINPDNEEVPVKVFKLGTGEPVPVEARNYIGSHHSNGGGYVWHYFMNRYS